jgi:aspartyl-tRNA(Asn)/glutamyl-tRNA(Gln) amidotransferase subunit C
MHLPDAEDNDMPGINEDMVKHVALLSRLNFSPEELKQYTEQLNSILAYMDKLNELDTSNVEPTSHSLKMQNVFREDKVEKSLSREETLQNAPDQEDGCFKVPRVI